MQHEAIFSGLRYIKRTGWLYVSFLLQLLTFTHACIKDSIISANAELLRVRRSRRNTYVTFFLLQKSCPGTPNAHPSMFYQAGGCSTYLPHMLIYPKNDKRTQLHDTYIHIYLM